MQQWLISFTILSHSRFVATLHLSSNVGRDVLGILMISRYLFCIDCNSSARYFMGKPPHTGDVYSRSGRILVQYIVIPISVGRIASYSPSNNTIPCQISLLSVQHGNSNIDCLVAIPLVALTWIPSPNTSHLFVELRKVRLNRVCAERDPHILGSPWIQQRII